MHAIDVGSCLWIESKSLDLVGSRDIEIVCCDDIEDTVLSLPWFCMTAGLLGLLLRDLALSQSSSACRTARHVALLWVLHAATAGMEQHELVAQDLPFGSKGVCVCHVSETIPCQLGSTGETSHQPHTATESLVRCCLHADGHPFLKDLKGHHVAMSQIDAKVGLGLALNFGQKWN